MAAEPARVGRARHRRCSGCGRIPPPSLQNYTCGSPSGQAPAAGFQEALSILGPRSEVGRSLVLNATLQPLAVVPARRAVVLVLKEKADIVHSDGIVFRSARVQIQAPSVVRLRYFVRVPYRAQAALSRRAVFARDGWMCQYCGKAAENVDHIIPRARGGSHSWENVVAACRRCNSRKESRLMHEVGMTLLRPPVIPRDGLRLSLGRLEPEWEPYL